MDRINIQANKNEELRFAKSQLARSFWDRLGMIQKAVNDMAQGMVKEVEIEKKRPFDTHQHLHNSLGYITK